ncbi:MAG: acetyl-CoA carboxylase carboxyltransferase subunit beta [Acidobacteria bacterium]|nr:acetyl-CoA carboxylase carboxyltransferase subunit beta [Acidobacteriota bacterium]MBI3658298.1 acetyl-CoA carboxylase carboxyltransferase subunit beta [Acidobacteriota bacterium]
MGIFGKKPTGSGSNESAPATIIKDEEKTVKTEGLFFKCEACRAVLYKKDIEDNLLVCPKCNFHFRVASKPRLAMLFDDGQFQEFDHGLRSPDPLNFVDKQSYRERLLKAQEATGMMDALISAHGRLGGYECIICAMEYQFIGGSMGSVVGEKITRAVERARAERKPVIIVSASGGARMMEGALSLMQMAKISAALACLHEAKIPYISVLTDPTTGGVTASFAMLGDLNIAEPGALIGFAGPRVIEQTIRQKLPKGFQRAEFLLEHGMLDAIVSRHKMKPFLITALKFFTHSV